MKQMIKESLLSLEGGDLERLLNLALNASLPFGPEYLKYKYNWTEEFGAGAIAEYRRFAYLALISAEMITPSEVIDEVWHCHILHTRAYEEFSELCKRKLHHSPGMPNKKFIFIDHYKRTLRMYADVFGEQPPRSYWPLTENSQIVDSGSSINHVLTLYLERYL